MFRSPVRRTLQVFLSLYTVYRANREISIKVLFTNYFCMRIGERGLFQTCLFVKAGHIISKEYRTKTSGIFPLARNEFRIMQISLPASYSIPIGLKTISYCHSTFNYVYLPFNDMSICQAIMVAFHLIMFHYHYHQLFLFRHLISYDCCSFNFNCERFEPRSHFIPVGFDLVSKKLFYHYLD